MEKGDLNISSIEKLSIARQMLAEAKSLDDILNIRDIAEAARVYAQAARLGLENQNEAAEIKIRAERRAGEMLAQMPKNKGADGSIVTGSTMEQVTVMDSTPTLADLGIERKQSFRWQMIASLPEDEFEEHIQETKAEGKEQTSAGVLKIVQKEKIAAAHDLRDATLRQNMGDKQHVKLIHGDMLDVMPTLGKFDLVVTDPPYGVTDYEWDILHTKEWLQAIIPHLADQYNLFWFCSPVYAADIELDMRALGLQIQSRIVWHRRNMAMGSAAKNKFIDTWEMIFHAGNRELNFPKDWSDAWFDVQEFAVPQTNFTDKKIHPTQKPEGLIQRLVEFGSYAGDHILDPFAGSGTAGAVCPDDRDVTLIEREDGYVGIAEVRLGIKRVQ